MRTLLVAALLLSGCAGTRLRYVREQSSQDMLCPVGEITATLSEKIDNTWYATGCGKTYVCHHDVDDPNNNDKYVCRAHEGPTP